MTTRGEGSRRAARGHSRKQSPKIFTIGHSTRTQEEFIEILHEHEIQHLVDVRSIPRSRRNPQFSKEQLESVLPNEGIAYTHLTELGGLRKPRRDSVNTGWRNASFRGFADYMGSEDFDRGIERLLQLAAEERAVIMCAEAVPWRCHRSLIADALTVRDVPVEHITSRGKASPHQLTSFASVKGRTITYPGNSGSPTAS